MVSSRRTAFAAVVSAAALGAAFLLPAVAAEAPAPAMICGERAKVLAALRAGYREVPVGMGMSHAGGMVELLAAPDGATWSVVVTAPDGRACLVAAGEAWRVVPTAVGKGI